MKRYSKMVAVLILLAAGAAASQSAMAHGGVRFGVNIGIPLYWPGYYPGPYYPYPAYAYPAPAYGYSAAPPAAYVEQGVPQTAPVQSQADWYYCPNSKSYYPYVRDCPGGWQRVSPQPPR